MINQLSIRATGLLTILQRSPDLRLDAENLSNHFTETAQYITHTLKELTDAGFISIDNNRLLLLDRIDLAPPNKTLEERIYSLAGYSKSSKVIAWFLGQLEKTFDLDSELRERISLESEAAHVVQFWSDYHIEQALKRALVDKSLGNVTLEDLRQLLIKRDRGEIVWQK